MTEEELILIEECGRCYMNTEQVAVILMKPVAEIETAMKDKSCTLWQRYNKGRMMSELKVRSSIINMAQQGSSQAQEIWIKLRNEFEIKNA